MKMELYEIVMGLYTVMMVAVIIALTLWIWGEIKDRIAMKKNEKFAREQTAQFADQLEKILLQKAEEKAEGLKTREAEEENDGE